MVVDVVIQLSLVVGVCVLLVSVLQVCDLVGCSSVVCSVDVCVLQDVGMLVSDGSSMLCIGVISVVGVYMLQSVQVQGCYVVQVLELNSLLWLEVQVNQVQVLVGGNVQLQVCLLEDGVIIVQLVLCCGGLGGEVLLVVLDGCSWLQCLLCIIDGSLCVQVWILIDVGIVQGLWELQVFVQVDGVLCDGKVVFVVVWLIVCFSGQVVLDLFSCQVVLLLQVVVVGCYEVCGMLYVMVCDGWMKLVVQVYVVVWFDGLGVGQLVLLFDQVVLLVGFGVLYELCDLQLQDQSWMVLIELCVLVLWF